MPGLLRGVARTAVVAGTATAVSNRVSRRQGERWSQQDRLRRTSSSSTPNRSTRSRSTRPPQPAAPPEDDRISALKQLGELHAQGILTDEEFAAEKAKILNSQARGRPPGRGGLPRQSCRARSPHPVAAPVQRLWRLTGGRRLPAGPPDHSAGGTHA